MKDRIFLEVERLGGRRVTMVSERKHYCFCKDQKLSDLSYGTEFLIERYNIISNAIKALKGGVEMKLPVGRKNMVIKSGIALTKYEKVSSLVLSNVCCC